MALDLRLDRPSFTLQTTAHGPLAFDSIRSRHMEELSVAKRSAPDACAFVRAVATSLNLDRGGASGVDDGRPASEGCPLDLTDDELEKFAAALLAREPYLAEALGDVGGKESQPAPDSVCERVALAWTRAEEREQREAASLMSRLGLGENGVAARVDAISKTFRRVQLADAAMMAASQSLVSPLAATRALAAFPERVGQLDGIRVAQMATDSIARTIAESSSAAQALEKAVRLPAKAMLPLIAQPNILRSTEQLKGIGAAIAAAKQAVPSIPVADTARRNDDYLKTISAKARHEAKVDAATLETPQQLAELANRVEDQSVVLHRLRDLQTAQVEHLAELVLTASESARAAADRSQVQMKIALQSQDSANAQSQRQLWIAIGIFAAQFLLTVFGLGLAWGGGADAQRQHSEAQESRRSLLETLTATQSPNEPPQPDKHTGTLSLASAVTTSNSPAGTAQEPSKGAVDAPSLATITDR